MKDSTTVNDLSHIPFEEGSYADCHEYLSLIKFDEKRYKNPFLELYKLFEPESNKRGESTYIFLFPNRGYKKEALKVDFLFNARKKYSYAVPSTEALREIVKYSPICEMGAGTGYWASLLNLLGADIVAYDTDPVNEGNNSYHKKRKPFYPVNKCDDNFIPPKERTLFLCWPPYNTEMAINALKRYEGSTLIYIGEGYGGCTGCDDFHDLLEEEWDIKEVIDLPSLYGIRDDLYIYTRKQINE